MFLKKPDFEVIFVLFGVALSGVTIVEGLFIYSTFPC